MSLLIQNGRVIDSANQVDAIVDVLIEDATIKRVGPKLAAHAHLVRDRGQVAVGRRHQFLGLGFEHLEG